MKENCPEDNSLSFLYTLENNFLFLYKINLKKPFVVSISVSYTHLDVYKRQDLFPDFINQFNSNAEHFNLQDRVKGIIGSMDVINGIELNIRSNHSSVQGNVCGSNKKSGLRIAGSKGISADGNSFRSNRGYAAEFIRSHISSYKGNRFEENGYSNRIHVRNSKISKK